MNSATIEPILSHPFDELRQQAADLFQAIAAGSGPFAYFKSQEQTVPYLTDLIKLNYGLGTHPAIVPLSTLHHGGQFPLARLFKYMSQHAPQI